MTNPHVGDIGTTFTLTIVDQSGVVVDLSGATTLEILFADKNSNGAAYEAELTTDGTDGKISYVTDGSEFELVGRWEIQAFIVTPGGSWHSDAAQFNVSANLV